ncbi:MAG: hypothetical protein JXB88_26045 [Spirochaetales bacterium]|nr:hypothetical protein [Spirochaetales bacterium]
MDYGTDFLLVDDDIVFTIDGDAKVVSGPRCIAQDIVSELKIVQGTLAWDKEAGSMIPLMLNSGEFDNETIIIELERVAIADPRIDPQSVKAEKVSDNKYRLFFTPLTAVEPEVLDFDFNTGGENV